MEIELGHEVAGRVAPHVESDVVFFDDPFVEDLATDALVVTNRRGLCRLAIVAAETGARFQREGMKHDPVAWLLAPRHLFDGGAAIDACLQRAPFVRATLLHGLSLGLDAHPDDVDELLDGRDEPDMEGRLEADGSASRAGASDVRLYTATVTRIGRGRTLHVFHASLARDAGEVEDKLKQRLGAAAASEAVVHEGFDEANRFASGMLSSPIVELLRYIAVHPDSPLAAGLDLHLEQRLGG